MLRNASIKVETLPKAQRIGSNLTDAQMAAMKTLAITPEFVQSIEASINAKTSFSAAPSSTGTTFHSIFGPRPGLASGMAPSSTLADLKLGNIRLDLSEPLKLYLSVSRSSSIAGFMGRASANSVEDIDWDDDLKKGNISQVEVETIILEACIKNVTDSHPVRQLTSTGGLLYYAAKSGIDFLIIVSLNLVERRTHLALAQVEGKFSTRDWLVRVPYGNGNILRISQALSKECFTQELRDVRDLLGWNMPKRFAIVLDVREGGNGHMDGNHWMYQYQSTSVAPHRQM